MSGICMDVRSKGRISGRLSRAKKKSIVIHEETLTEVSFCEARSISLMDFLRQNRPSMYSNIARVGSQYVVKARYYGTKGP